MTLTLSGSGNPVTIDGTDSGLTLVRETAKSATGTSVDFTGIPSWVKRVTVVFNQVSNVGTSNYMIQLGTSAGFKLTGYNSTSIISGGSVVVETDGLVQTNIVVAANSYSGLYTIVNVSDSTWIGMGSVIQCSNVTGASNQGGPSTGQVQLGGTLDRIRITTVTGINAFDGGTINIMYE